jgi:hypothetical protein
MIGGGGSTVKSKKESQAKKPRWKVSDEGFQRASASQRSSPAAHSVNTWAVYKRQ